jgi:hypothetical protein
MVVDLQGTYIWQDRDIFFQLEAPTVKNPEQQELIDGTHDKIQLCKLFGFIQRQGEAVVIKETLS